jgi:hypothetical protein
MQSTTSVPVLRYEGRPQPARQAIPIELGLSLDGRLATCKCLNMRCVNPEHIVAVTRQQLQRGTTKATKMHSNPAR